MFRIGTFSKLVRVSARMLRFYEKCGLLLPARVDAENGYRLYSAAQIPLVARIVALRDMGFGTAEIGELMEHGDDPAYLEAALLTKRSAIETAIAGEGRRLELIGRALDRMKENVPMKNFTVELKKLPAIQILSLRDTMPSYYHEAELWHRLYSAVAHSGAPRDNAGAVYSIYHDTEYKESDVDVEIGIPWQGAAPAGEPFTIRQLEEVPMAVCVLHEGPYETIGEATNYAAAWIQENGYEIVGANRGMGLGHPENEKDKEHFRTEIQFPVAKK